MQLWWAGEEPIIIGKSVTDGQQSSSMVNIQIARQMRMDHCHHWLTKHAARNGRCEHIPCAASHKADSLSDFD